MPDDATTDTPDADTATEVDTPQAPTDVPDTPHEQHADGEKGNAEAARYRRRLRATEAERDALLARVEHMQRGEVERLVTDRLSDPGDVWRGDAAAQITELLDSDGHVDPAKVNTAVDAVLNAHPHWAVQRSRPTGFQSGAAANHPKIDPFENAFRPPNR